jgi:hypothetical protein
VEGLSRVYAGHQGIAAVARAELARGVSCHNPTRLIPKLACDPGVLIDSRKHGETFRHWSRLHAMPP